MCSRKIRAQRSDFHCTCSCEYFCWLFAGFLLALRAAIEKDLRVLTEKNKTAGRLSTIKADVSEKNLTSTQ